MRIALCYTAVARGPLTADYASRFVASWLEHPPGAECDVFILCNGGMLAREVGLIFAPLSPRFVARSNTGWDIGGAIEAANGPCATYDLMLCLGESVHFHREGWLARLAEAHAKHGEGMYGCFGSYVIRPHLQTTAFATSPGLLRRYPHKVESREDRYQFEHGKQSFWKWVVAQGKPALLVTWDGCYPVRQWRAAPNILWRGDQSNCLMWTNHTDRYAKANDATKRQWARNADTLRDWGMDIAPINAR